MKKAKPAPATKAPVPATDEPTGGPPVEFSMRAPFTLVAPEEVHQHNPLFITHDADQAKASAAHYESNGHPDMAEWHREQARLLELQKDDKEGVTLLKWEFEQNNVLQAELMYLLAKKGNEEAVRSVGRKTYDQFWHLKKVADTGNAEALQSLARIAIEATEVVNRHMKTNASTFIPVASRQTHWPFLKSTNKKLNPIKNEAKKLNEMELGSKTNQDLDPRSRYTLDTPAMRVAKKLLDYINHLRGTAQLVFRGELPSVSENKVESLSVLIAAAHLPVGPRTNAEINQWWTLARQILLESYPALGTKSEAGLTEIAPTLLGLSAVQGPVNTKRKKILYNLQRPFETILSKTQWGPPPSKIIGNPVPDKFISRQTTSRP